MGLFDFEVMKWSLWKKLAVLMAILIVAGVFLNWSEFSWEVNTGIGTVERSSTTDGMDWTEGPTLALMGLLALLFLLIKAPIIIDIAGDRKRLNELLAAMLAFLTLVNAYRVYDDIRDEAESLETSVSSYSFNVGPGLYMIIAGSFLLLVFSIIVYREITEPQLEAPVAEGEVVEEKKKKK